MAEYKVSGTDLTSVANAIRTKGGTSAGLSFPDGFVSAVQNIPTGGGSTLITKNITENGTYSASSDNADGYSEVSVAVSPKFVTGTFIGTIAETAIDVTVPYMGNGYPVACVVYPSAGTNKTGNDFAILVQKQVEVMFSMVKADISSTPTYNDRNALENKASITSMYKYSDSDPAIVSSGGTILTYFYRNENAGASWNTCLRFKTNKTMSVYIASTGYGFAKDIEYTYQIVYSS